MVRVGPSRIRSDQVGSLENLEISGYSGKYCYLHKWKFAFFPALFTQRETAWQICKMDGDEGKTFYVIRFLDHFFENYCIELPYQYFIFGHLWIRSDFYTCMIRPGPQSGPTFIPARSDLIRRGLAIRSNADWRSGPTIIPASKTHTSQKVIRNHSMWRLRFIG